MNQQMAEQKYLPHRRKDLYILMKTELTHPLKKLQTFFFFLIIVDYKSNAKGEN